MTDAALTHHRSLSAQGLTRADVRALERAGELTAALHQAKPLQLRDLAADG